MVFIFKSFYYYFLAHPHPSPLDIGFLPSRSVVSNLDSPAKTSSMEKKLLIKKTELHPRLPGQVSKVFYFPPASLLAGSPVQYMPRTCRGRRWHRATWSFPGRVAPPAAQREMNSGLDAAVNPLNLNQREALDIKRPVPQHDPPRCLRLPAGGAGLTCGRDASHLLWVITEVSLPSP